MSGIVRAIAALLAGCALAGACTSAEPSPRRDPVRLTLTTYDEDHTPGAALVHRFVDELTALDPGITVTVRFHGSPQEPDAVSAVSSGSADLVMVASRAFDTAGVTTLQALNAPLLIDSQELADAVATSTLVPDLLAGLDDIGVTGLAIATEGMRHLFGRRAPPVAVGDLKGATVRSPQSQAVWAFLSAAGATPIFDETRSYELAESQFDQAPADKGVGNVTLFAKFDVLGINARTAGRLGTDRMRALELAATRAAAWAGPNRPRDAELARAFCARGGEIRHADSRQVEQWRAVAAPVVDTLRSVPSTSRLVDGILTMKKGIDSAGSVAECSPPAARASSRLNGRYTYAVTEEALRAVGIHDQTFIDENAGTVVVTLDDGRMTTEHRYGAGANAGTTDTDVGSYTIEGDTVTFTWSAQQGDHTSATVTVLADGSLEFRDWVEGLDEPKFLLQDQVTLKHWDRVADGG